MEIIFGVFIAAVIAIFVLYVLRPSAGRNRTAPKDPYGPMLLEQKARHDRILWASENWNSDNKATKEKAKGILDSHNAEQIRIAKKHGFM